MPVTEYLCAALIVVVLVSLASYFGWRQWLVLRALDDQPDLSPEDRSYHRRQSARRLLCGVLMVVLAALLGGWYLLGLDRQVVELVRQGRPPDADQRRMLRWSLGYLIAAVLVLLGMLFLAALDLWAIRRYGLRHYRQIQTDRRLMIERQAARLRQQRNGHA